MLIRNEMVGNKYYETRKFPVKLKNGSTGVGAFIREITEQIISEKAVQVKTADIERFNNAMVDRELKMEELVELKILRSELVTQSQGQR